MPPPPPPPEIEEGAASNSSSPVLEGEVVLSCRFPVCAYACVCVWVWVSLPQLSLSALLTCRILFPFRLPRCRESPAMEKLLSRMAGEKAVSKLCRVFEERRGEKRKKKKEEERRSVCVCMCVCVGVHVFSPERQAHKTKERSPFSRRCPVCLVNNCHCATGHHHRHNHTQWWWCL